MSAETVTTKTSDLSDHDTKDDFNMNTLTALAGSALRFGVDQTVLSSTAPTVATHKAVVRPNQASAVGDENPLVAQEYAREALPRLAYHGFRPDKELFKLYHERERTEFKATMTEQDHVDANILKITTGLWANPTTVPGQPYPEGFLMAVKSQARPHQSILADY